MAHRYMLDDVFTEPTAAVILRLYLKLLKRIFLRCINNGPGIGQGNPLAPFPFLVFGNGQHKFIAE
jgi:hypothetical protein